MCSARAEELAARGTTCPDHFLRTKIWPLFVPFDPARAGSSDLLDRLESLVEGYGAAMRPTMSAVTARIPRSCATHTRSSY